MQISVLKPGLPQLTLARSPQVRMAILRIIGQLVLSGFQEKIKGWGLKYVSVQLTLSTYKLVSGPNLQPMGQMHVRNGLLSVEPKRNASRRTCLDLSRLMVLCRYGRGLCSLLGVRLRHIPRHPRTQCLGRETPSEEGEHS